jgi:hypothetical protein
MIVAHLVQCGRLLEALVSFAFHETTMTKHISQNYLVVITRLHLS